MPDRRSPRTSTGRGCLKGIRPRHASPFGLATRTGGGYPSGTEFRGDVLNVHITEFTDPVVPRPKDKRLDKWLFTMKDHKWFCMAGIWRNDPKVGEAFTLLTMDAGDDIRPYHDRQIIPLTRDQWADWLNPEVPAEDVLKYLPTGTLTVSQVWPPPADAPEQPALGL